MLEERLKRVMGEILEVDPGTIGGQTDMDSVAAWDSLRHMRLVLAIEDEFGVSIPDEDAANITSYPIIVVVLRELLEAS